MLWAEKVLIRNTKAVGLTINFWADGLARRAGLYSKILVEAGGTLFVDFDSIRHENIPWKKKDYGRGPESEFSAVPRRNMFPELKTPYFGPLFRDDAERLTQTMLPLLTLVTLIVGASASWGSSEGSNSNACKTVTTQQGVDLNQFVAKRWFIHEQMATQAGMSQHQHRCKPDISVLEFLSDIVLVRVIEGNPDGRWSYCVYADYRLKDSTTVSVKNHAEEGSVRGVL